MIIIIIFNEVIVPDGEILFVFLLILPRKEFHWIIFSDNRFGFVRSNDLEYPANDR